MTFGASQMDSEVRRPSGRYGLREEGVVRCCSPPSLILLPPQRDEPTTPLLPQRFEALPPLPHESTLAPDEGCDVGVDPRPDPPQLEELFGAGVGGAACPWCVGCPITCFTSLSLANSAKIVVLLRRQLFRFPWACRGEIKGIRVRQGVF
ncbi:hypothetical protein E2C01_102745 [Portunus trituberculatus]|uniref:Uncharacterized protein n=1 Tax=Portunus trituberculatus TaxID=210409 RepID=A0A5B7KI30_PORTR|nr:hypothetical protein [Portunus trituberculatus]